MSVASYWLCVMSPIFTAIAETLDCKICVSREKKSILQCLEDESLCKRLTLMKHEARVHVLAMNQISSTVCYLLSCCLVDIITLHLLLCFFLS